MAKAIPTLDELCETVRQAKPLVFDRGLASDISEKSIYNYVTRADTSVQTFIRDRLGKAYPECRFMGEESDDHAIDPSVPTFVLDPIDGTTNFIHDMRLSAISLALVFGGETVLAVVLNPFTDELFTAEKGHGAYLNGSRIHVSDAPDISHALVAVGTMPYRKDISEKYFGLYHELFVRGVDIRRIGTAVLDACYVAAGRTDCYIEDGLGTWDIAASRLIVAEAGGKVTDWNGGETALDRESNDIAVSNGLFHDSLLEIIRNYR